MVALVPPVLVLVLLASFVLVARMIDRFPIGERTKLLLIAIADAVIVLIALFAK